MSSNPLMMGYEGNRRSGVALAMRHRLSASQWSIHLRAQRPMCGRWAPCLVPTPQGMASLPFPYTFLDINIKESIRNNENMNVVDFCNNWTIYWSTRLRYMMLNLSSFLLITQGLIQCCWISENSERQQELQQYMWAGLQFTLEEYPSQVYNVRYWHRFTKIQQWSSRLSPAAVENFSIYIVPYNIKFVIFSLLNTPYFTAI